MSPAQSHLQRQPLHGAGPSTLPAAARAVSVLAFPLALAGAVGLALGLPTLGAAPELALMAAVLSSLCWVWLAEYLLPYDTQPRNASDHDHTVDGTSMALVMAVVDPALKALWPVLTIVLWELLGWPDGLALFPVAQPLWLKLPAALLVAGLGEYGMHRLSHQWAPMWGFHALHHSAHRIYWLNGFRVHPFNLAWHQLAGYAVLLFAGVDAQTLMAFAAVSMTVATFQHANAKLRLGVLNRIFSTNELHRWHHDARPGHSHVNFGPVVSVWDQLFGTYRQSATEQPGRPGLDATSGGRVRSDRYWAQFFGPLRRPGVYATAEDRDPR